MTIQQCKYVLEIANSGSFSETAKNLFISQAGLSSAVKELETELNIKIFNRSNRGISISQEGVEFIRYARQIVSQVKIVKERYDRNIKISNFSVSTQHYDFVAEAFVKLIKDDTNSQYKLSLRETKTYEVIQDVKSLTSEVGILVVAQLDSKLMDKVFKENKLLFHPLLHTKPHLFVGEHHPLAKKELIEKSDILQFPYITYEQGEENSIQFSEELFEPFEHKNGVKINDRATLMNLLLDTNCCTIGTGIMASKLNNGKIVSVPVNSHNLYSVGWISRKDVELSENAIKFIDALSGIMPNNLKE